MHCTIKALATFALAALALTACDENTSELGIYSETDEITSSTKSFLVTTFSKKMDAVEANSTISYLGAITDPETGSDITADFAAQFYTFENYKFPPKNQMMGMSGGTSATGIIQCDSCEVRLYYDDYYGDGNNPMKIEVYELSKTNILKEDVDYLTNIDLTQFLPAGATALATRLFTPRDENVDEETLSGSSYNHNVRIVLPQTLGQRIMESYYEDEDNFADSYHFIRKVFPGLYFKTSGSKGTMLSVYVGTLNIFYHYQGKDGKEYNGITRFAATPEVIQSTHFTNENVDALIAQTSCTYLKTPAAICTAMELPIREIFSGSHATDSISLASITLNRYNKTQTSYQLGTPETLLMLREKDLQSFFSEHRVADGRTAYTTSFSSTYNSYTFNNICRLISYCQHEKMADLEKENKARIACDQPAMTEDEWEAAHDGWNRVLLIPVVTSTNASGNQVSVTHDLSLNSIRLIGGDTKLQMQVVYNNFNP